ncbi:MAG TPA: type ISP restriction/modification enzyme [Chloroflexia bacterium]|nr:type ISP restriction/modification enzyme [Chloroflexia bacterium]
MTPLDTYLKNIQDSYRQGNATEHTYRPALKALIEALQPGLTATNEPQRIACGAPDYIITKGQAPLGYIEAKDVDVNLSRVENTPQLKRYRDSLGNLVLTDYLEFRWYYGGELRLTARLAAINGNKLKAEQGGAAAVESLLRSFLASNAPLVNNPKELAKSMANVAQLIRQATVTVLQGEGEHGSLHQQLESFRRVLLPGLTREEFADMYAQTICYGLFAARCHTKTGQPFDRYSAAHFIPRSNPFLQNVFYDAIGPDLDERINWAVDHVAELLNRADIDAILKDFGKRTRQEDPVVHFYETFLAAYDPKMREARGVYYTPEPVVSYIVRSVDHLLKTEFGLSEGLADPAKISRRSTDGKTLEAHRVQILDPATGTGTFLHSVIDHIYEQSFKGNAGMWAGYVSEHLLPRLFGFELLMAPYTVAHLKLELQLKEMGYSFQNKERLNIFLTNTLQEHFESGRTLWGDKIKDEADAAGHVKHDYQIMVVLGNPPYSYESENNSKWVSDLVRDYYVVDGQPLGERNPRGLQDDYVKFLRFAQWRIQHTGYGVLAFITNHGYLDNPTFRGMRQSLMQTFDDIYVLDLHGNSKKKEKSPDGTPDQNVFDIQQGVAIGLFVKRPGAKKGPATVRHADLYGPREVFARNGSKPQLTGGKYHWLWENNVASTPWIQIQPKTPYYFFFPQNEDLKEEYEKGWDVKDLMKVNSGGMNTARDALVIDVDKHELETRIRHIREFKGDLDDLAKSLNVQNTSWWSFDSSVKNLRQTPSWEKLIIKCLYRPFDERWLLYLPSFIDRPRTEANAHLLQPNLSLVTTRQTKEPFAVVATDLICGQHKIAAVYDRSYFFPLYLYPDTEKKTLFDFTDEKPYVRKANLSEKFVKEAPLKLGLRYVPDGCGDLQATFGPEDLFHYMYAVFHAPTYRSRYAEFLKIDFPRLPLTSDAKLFAELCHLGQRLTVLHLLEQTGPLVTTFPQKGSDIVEKVEYTPPSSDGTPGLVWINKQQYFENVPPEVWEFHVGGYQVCQKWLKDRKGRKLDFNDLQHYRKIVAALAETRQLMARIDEVIEQHGGWPLR